MNIQLQQKIKRGESAEATRQGESAHVNKSLTIIMTVSSRFHTYKVLSII